VTLKVSVMTRHSPTLGRSVGRAEAGLGADDGRALGTGDAGRPGRAALEAGWAADAGVDATPAPAAATTMVLDG
jgi:hypothetical protein